MATKVKESMTIILPIKESDYDIFEKDNAVARTVIRECYDTYPEIFPLGMSAGWCLNGKDRRSKKSGCRLWRIMVGETVCRIRPCFSHLIIRGKRRMFGGVCSY